MVCASAGQPRPGRGVRLQPPRLTGAIFLPSNTPRQKRQRIEAIGGEWVELVFVGQHVRRRQRSGIRGLPETGAVYVHPFDDPRTIAGQGTVAIEIAEQFDGAIGTVIVPSAAAG